MWDKVMDINPEEESSYTIPYQKAFLKNVENNDCAKHPRISIIKPGNSLLSHFFPSAKGSGFVRSSLIYMICPVIMLDT
jgi:hypothetical protein